MHYCNAQQQCAMDSQPDCSGEVYAPRSSFLQSVKFSQLSGSDWSGDVASVYEVGYGIAVGVYNRASNQFKAQCSVSSALNRRALAVTFTVTTPEQAVTSYSDAAVSLQPGALVNALGQANQALGKNVEIPQQEQ